MKFLIRSYQVREDDTFYNFVGLISTIFIEISSQVCKKILNAFHKLKLQRDFLFHELEDECGFSFFVAADKPPHLRLLKLPISRVTPLALLRYITLWAFL